MSSPSSPTSIFGSRVFLLALVTVGVALLVSQLPFFDGKGDSSMFGRQQATTGSRVVTCPLELITSLSIEAVGVTQPTRSSNVASAVYGKIEWLNPKFHEGGMFEKDEVMVMLSKGNYEALLAEKIAELEQAKLELAAEQIETMKSVRKYDSSGKKKGSESDLVLRLPNRRLASSRVEAGEAAVKAANEALERTTIKAPYDCTVSSTMVDLGSVVKGGDSVCSVFSSFEREVRLNLPVEYLPYLGGKVNGVLAIPVVIKAPVLGAYTWPAVIQTVKGDVNTQSLTVTLIAAIMASDTNPAPLMYCPVRLPVVAEIRLALPSPGYRIPRSALVDVSHVWVVDAEGRLAKRKAEVLGPVMDDLLVNKDHFRKGDILCLSVKGEAKEGEQVIAASGQQGGDSHTS